MGNLTQIVNQANLVTPKKKKKLCLRVIESSYYILLEHWTGRTCRHSDNCLHKVQALGTDTLEKHRYIVQNIFQVANLFWYRKIDTELLLPKG